MLVHLVYKYFLPRLIWNLLIFSQVKNRKYGKSPSGELTNLPYLEKIARLPIEGSDHKASVTPEELKLLCEGIRAVEKSLGSSEKMVTALEAKNKIVARKLIIAACPIKKGEIYTTENLITKRPGNGISPMFWYELLGKEAEMDFEEDQLIQDSRFQNQE